VAINICQALIPGINCEDFANIFEEHKVVNALDPFSYESNVFAKRERQGLPLFHFSVRPEPFPSLKPPKTGFVNHRIPKKVLTTSRNVDD